VPQVLINREPLRHLNFDVELLGDCDVIVNELCHHLGGHFSELCSTPLPAAEITTEDVTLPPASVTVSDSYVSTVPVDSVPAALGTRSASGHFPDLCSTPSPDTKIITEDVTLPPASITVSDIDVSAIPVDSAPVATGSTNIVDNAVDISLPAMLSGSSSKASPNLAQATTGHATSNVDDVSATASASSSSADQTVTDSTADDMVRSPEPPVEGHADTVGSLVADSETAANSDDVNDSYSKNAEHHAQESPNTQAVSWASLLKRMRYFVAL